MDRAEKAGLGIAIAGHALLFGLLSIGFLATPNPAKLHQTPVEVSLVKDVALEAAAPQAVTPPAQSVAPDQGAPEEAAAPAPEEPAPEPEPAPPPPAPKPQPAPAKPAPAKPEPKPAPKPVPPKPAPKAAPEPKPQPKPKPAAAEAKPAPAKAKPVAHPAPAKAAPKDSTATASGSKPAAKAAPAKPAASKATGSSATATAAKPRGSRLGADFLKGLTDAPTKSTSEAPRAAKIDARALAGIQDAITRQIQPCADRQVDPGPGANQIVTVLNLRLNPDGTLSATPTMVRQSGTDDDNGRYARRVVDLGIAALKGCSPLKLPAEYYATANGGWNNINYTWRLR